MFTLRLKLDSRLREDPLGFSDGLFFHNGDDLRFELGLFRDGVVVDDLTQVAVQLKSANATSEDAAWFIQYDESPSAALTAATWKAGTAETATVDVAATYTSIPAGNYLLTISATTSGGDHETYYAGRIVVSESGYGTSTIDNPGALLYYDAVTSDAKFARKSYEARVEALEVISASPAAATPYATVADLPAGANGTGDTIFGYVYDDDPDNGLYFEEDGSSTWALVAGDPNARITVVETDLEDANTRTQGLYNQTAKSGDVQALIVDSAAKLILGQDEVTGKLVGEGFHDVIDAVYAQLPNDFVIVDSAYKVIYDSRDTTTSTGVDLPVAAKPFDIEIILFYGQSNAVGIGGVPVIHRDSDGYHLGATGGAYSIPGVSYPIINLVENEVGAGTRGEVGCRAFVDRLDEEWALYDNSGTAPKYCAFSAGIASTTYAALKKGTANYTALTTGIQYVFDYAAARSLSCGIRAVFWHQGESHNSETLAQQTANLEELQTDLDTDLKAITSQSEDVHLFAMQVSGDVTTETAAADCALGQIAADANNTGTIHIVAPTYGTDQVFYDGIHFNAYGHSYHARLAAQSFIDEFIGSGAKALDVSATIVGTGTTITITFNVTTANLPLWIDTKSFAKITNWGFKVTDGGGVMTVSGIYAIDNTIILTMGSTITPGSVTVRYALDYKRADEPLLNAGAGNVRDSNPNYTIVRGVTIPGWKFVPAFTSTFTAT
jgi:hypothetical protein